MKNYFFVNPASGQGKGIDRLVRTIERTSDELSMESIVYITKDVGDGESQARKIAESLDGRPARFFACGGDGTNNEIINGAVSFDNIIFGCVPIGTGNDFVRCFPQAGDFLSIKDQLLGTSEEVDLIRYSGVMDGVFRERYCANMFNIGFDCNVVELAGRLKKKPMISGSLAYLMAILGVFLKKDTIGLKLEHDGETILDEKVLLCSIANGNYCGGGIHTAPQAEISDGVFDLNVIRDVSRTEFIKLFPSYKAGKHLEIEGIEDVIRISRHESLSLTPKSGKFFLCADGEICIAEKIDFEIAHKAMKFNVPAK